MQDFLGIRIPSDVHPGVRFRIDRRLATGATAVAYLATRISPEGNSPAVVKIILPSIVEQAGETAQMVVRKEAVALGRLNERVPPTPFVVRLLDSGLVPYRDRAKSSELPWLAIEYVHGGVEGTTLEERVVFSVEQTRFAFDRERAARAIAHVCEGLAEVHEVGVIHRDLNPNNVLCCGFGQAEVFKLSDFGIARPVGMEATFGATVLGTAGYIAPEQGFCSDENLAPRSDIFSMAAITYFVLTGEAYFAAANPVQALMAARTDDRRSLSEARALCPELRADREAVRAIDEALARASAVDPKARPGSARALASSILPWLTGGNRRAPSERHVQSVMRADSSRSVPGWSWTIRHPPGDDCVVQSVGWDGDGHCLAATSRGLGYWNGTEWLAVPARELPVPDAIRFVTRIDSGRWLIGSHFATLAEYSRAGVTRILRGPDGRATFSSASGDISDLAVVVAECPGSPPLLCGVAAGRWLKPLAVEQAASISAVARIDDTHWLVAGRGVDGKGFAANYAPLMWQLETLPVPQSRALVACAARGEHQTAIAVGSHGAVLRVERGNVSGLRLAASPDLAAAAIDVLNRTWVGALGELWVSAAPAEDWARVWSDETWRAPFISILAEVGLVVAMTADGAVLECRASQSAAGLLPGSSAPPAGRDA